jgi:thymidylate synthase (FAD)
MDVEFIGQSVEYVGGYGGDETIESAARTCTQTEVGGDSEGFVKRLVERGHMSPTEFGWADWLIECDRAIQQELTRHRHFTFNIESTRLVNYLKKTLRFVTKPPEDMDVPPEAVELLENLCVTCAEVYEILLEMGAPRDYARKALPLATASRMRMAGNLRAWFEMLPKRTDRAAHPEIRELAREISGILHDKVSGTIFRR